MRRVEDGGGEQPLKLERCSGRVELVTLATLVMMTTLGMMTTLRLGSRPREERDDRPADRRRLARRGEAARECETVPAARRRGATTVRHQNRSLPWRSGAHVISRPGVVLVTQEDDR